MPGRTKAPTDEELMKLVAPVVEALRRAEQPEPAALKDAVKALAAVLAERHPGRTVEARIPPYAAVQCLEGPRHTRGTPPNVVEADPIAWVELCTGLQGWSVLVRDGRIRASGERADLSGLVPLLVL